MTFDDLQRALQAEVATGSIGVPVSIRLNVAIPQTAAGREDTLARFQALPDRLFASQPERQSLLEQKDHRQIVAMGRYPGGQTSLIVVSHGCGPEQSCDLLIVGNRGIIRLEGGELIRTA
jgi:hypothetical protein